jgi:hypothetical protein
MIVVVCDALTLFTLDLVLDTTRMNPAMFVLFSCDHAAEDLHAFVGTDKKPESEFL